MKYLGKDDNGLDTVIDLTVEYPEGPTVINILVNNVPTPVTVMPEEVIVRLTSGGWPIVFTQEAFDASFTKIEE